MQKILRFHTIQLLTLVAVAVWATSAAAITIEIDYSTDTSGFFGANNSQGAAAGAQAKASLEAAAQFYSGILEDDFTEIAASKFYGSLGGEANFFWKRRFIDPATGFNNARVNQEFAADKFVVFVGARDLPDPTTLGVGGPGGFDSIKSTSHGSFTSAENTQIGQMLDELSDSITDRGQTSGFARWGGSIAFDSPTVWHFDHTTDPAAGTQDFFSVALHELAHTLGFGASDEWNALVTGTNFTGASAEAVFGDNNGVPLSSADDTAHWSPGIAMNPVFEGAGLQTPIMVPALPSATRRGLTNLDAAALVDLGWEIDLPAGAAAAASFVTTSGASGATSVAALRASVVPEPSGMMLLLFVSMTSLLFGPRRKRLPVWNCSGVPRS